MAPQTSDVPITNLKSSREPLREAPSDPVRLPEREARMAAGVASGARVVQAPAPARSTCRFALLPEVIEGFTAITASHCLRYALQIREIRVQIESHGQR
jgi:hypothetical protein